MFVLPLNLRLIVGVPAAPAAVLAALMVLGACGQKGPLYLPTEPAAANRATLPQTLNPLRAPSSAASAVPSPAPTASQPQ